MDNIKGGDETALAPARAGPACHRVHGRHDRGVRWAHRRLGRDCPSGPYRPTGAVCPGATSWKVRWQMAPTRRLRLRHSDRT
jgi:hypothetical protein